MLISEEISTYLSDILHPEDEYLDFENIENLKKEHHCHQKFQELLEKHQHISDFIHHMKLNEHHEAEYLHFNFHK